MQLNRSIAALTAVTPAMIRGPARPVAAEGLASEAASAAAAIGAGTDRQVRLL
jgi:hypothetical protein